MGMIHTAEVAGVGVGLRDEEDEIPAVVLEARDELMPIAVTMDQARAIQLALSEEPFERPLTHDLFVTLLTEFGGAIDGVRIDDIADGTFYAKLDVERYHDGQKTKHVFDVRPSDAVALAVRTESRISISDAVLNSAGQPLDAFDTE